jgi:lipid II:glycine glycyltransferase (peptidoglycan interpeptide bridge formation enzyme)
MRDLLGRVPDDIAVVVARHGGTPVAGVVLFDGARVSHAQYIASSSAGNDAGALDAVFGHCLARARTRGARYFDFGTSNLDEGRVLNEGLYGFKSQFGGGGVPYERYELDLRTATPKPVSP